MWLCDSLFCQIGWQLYPQEDNSLENAEKHCISMWSGYFLLDFFLFLFVSSYLVFVVPWSTTWTFASNVKALALPGLSVSLISSGAMNSVSKSFINWSTSPSLPLCKPSNNVNTCSVEASPSVVFLGNYSLFNSLLINPSQLHYN